MPRMPVNEVADAELTEQIETDRASIADLARQLAYLGSRPDRQVMHAKTRKLVPRLKAIKFLAREQGRCQRNLDALLREQSRRTQLN